MQQIIDFFRGILNVSEWPPRWHCGNWSDFHGWLFILSDLMIWSAYFAIPLLILRFISKRKDVKFHKIYFLFAAFILACGCTHFLDAVAFWYPSYRLNALILFITGLISWITVVNLVKLLPVAFSMKTSAELENEVEQRKKAESEILTKSIKLQYLNTELKQLTFVASHDLQEPLRKISTYTSLLETEVQSHLGKEAREYVEKIKSSSIRMQSLIHNLLDFTNLNNNEFSFSKVSLDHVVERVLSNLKSPITNSNASIDVAKLPVIDGNYGQLTQLFQNLLSNSIKFRADTESPKISINAEVVPYGSVSELIESIQKNGYSIQDAYRPESDELYCRIILSDQGIGFDESYLDRIFDIFQRLHSQFKYVGTGIGLAICKKIAENHHGFITARSKPGNGSVFIVLLPVAQKVLNEPAIL